MSHGRRPSPPTRTGPTRSTIDSCPVALMLLPFFLLKLGAQRILKISRPGLDPSPRVN